MLTTAGKTFSSIGAKLGSGFPAISVGREACTDGAVRESVKPRLNAKAFNRNDVFFMATILSLPED